MTALGSNGTERVNGTRDVVAALGHADRDREVAQSTRRVVMASIGVLRDQKAGRKRGRAVALAATLLVILSLAPLVWLVVDHFNSGGRMGDLTTELMLWVCILCPALLAAALVGWLRKTRN